MKSEENLITRQRFLYNLIKQKQKQKLSYSLSFHDSIAIVSREETLGCPSWGRTEYGLLIYHAKTGQSPQHTAIILD